MKNQEYISIVNVYPYSKWIGFTLCLLLGIFGAHKYYERKLGWGILYTLTFGLFGVGVLVDLIHYLSMPSPYYKLKENKQNLPI